MQHKNKRPIKGTTTWPRNKPQNCWFIENWVCYGKTAIRWSQNDHQLQFIANNVSQYLHLSKHLNPTISTWPNKSTNTKSALQSQNSKHTKQKRREQWSLTSLQKGCALHWWRTTSFGRAPTTPSDAPVNGPRENQWARGVANIAGTKSGLEKMVGDGKQGGGVAGSSTACGGEGSEGSHNVV